MDKPKVGDWIAFYSNGVIKYSEIRYIVPRIGLPDHLCTHDGTVSADAVLELRALLEIDDE